MEKWRSFGTKRMTRQGQDEPSSGTECSFEEVTSIPAIPKSTTKNTSNKEIHNQSSSEEQNAFLDSERKDHSQSTTTEMESVVRKIFPDGLKKDWMDCIVSVYHAYHEKITLSAYTRVLQNVSENIERINEV